MPVDRELWNEEMTETRCPEGWHCPRCSGGYLSLMKDSLHHAKSASSASAANQARRS